MAKETEQTTSTTTEEPPRDAEQAGDGRASDAGHVCNVAFCPIGLALSAVQPMKPDVDRAPIGRRPRVLPGGEGGHDARADDLSKDGGASTFEKIDIG